MAQEESNTTAQSPSDLDPSKPESLVAFLEKEARPVDFDTLAADAGADDTAREVIRATLDRLLAQGGVVETRDGRYGVPSKMNLVVGRLSCHEKGFGFVIPRDPAVDDLYIPRRKLGDALHGDIVVARRESARGGKTEGRVIRLLKRARTQVVGTFEKGPRFGYVVPVDPRIGYEVFVAEGEVDGAKPGQMVCAEITSYPEGNGRRSPEGKIVEVLGDPDDPRIDVEVIIREFDLAHEFPAEVLAEADKIPTEVTDKDLENRKDYRELPVVTIDGENAKDFDDAVHVEVLENGNYQLTVHIADVSAYVPVGSAIDQEAQRRATSVYFPDRVVPMLPENLSNEICSLKPGVDRLVQSVEMEIDGKGKTVNFEFHDGVIRSAARMTYKEVAALVEGSDDKLAKKYADHVEHFQRMTKLCDRLRAYRARRGSIDFDLPEPELLINLRGEVEDIFRSERNQAHRIIEEFMIRCNEVVASHLTWEDVPALYRCHEGPDAEKVEQFRDFIGGLDLQLGGGKSPSPKSFQSLVEHLEGQPGERVIIYLMLRTMKQARYQADNIGHFGLASERYTHFTSPIRRYPDLVVHRLLKADLGSSNQAEFDVEALQRDLQRIGADCSEQERTAEEAERRYVDWKTVQFMADKLGESFEGFITGVHAYGFFIELDRYLVDGLVHVSSLNDDYYVYDERSHSLKGEAKGRTFTLGNRVKVQLVKVDKGRRRLDFALEEGPLEAGIKPFEAKDEERADAEAKPSRRRRGRRGRGRGKKAEAGSKDKDAKDKRGAKKKAAGKDKDAKGKADDKRGAKGGDEDAKGDGRKRRRRRGGKKASKSDDSGKQEAAGDKAAQKGGGRKKSTKKSSKSSGGRKKSAKKSSGGRKKSTRKAASGGRKKQTRKKSSDGRKKTAKKSTRKTDSKPKSTKVEPAKEGSPSKVNPYLTDL